jgi:hypothetical protein
VRGRSLIVLVVLAACRESTAPRTVSGDWTGATTVGSMNFLVSATLADAGGSVSGTGHVVSAGIDCVPSIAGNRNGSAVSLTLNCQGYSPFTYAGDLSRNGRSVIGRLSGSGFDNDVLVLSKQD